MMTVDQTGGVAYQVPGTGQWVGGGCFSYIITIFRAIKYVDIITPCYKGT